MTINLDQAKKLHELGVRKKPLKYWGVMDEDYRGKPRITDAWTDTGIYDHIYPAYNSEELVGMLKADLEIYRFEGDWTISTAMNHGNPSQDCTVFYAATLTEVLGDKLIHDLENGIVSLEDVSR